VVDVIVTALVLSAGTEGFNSILKFLGYAKEDKKAQAVESLKTAVPQERTDALLSGLNPPQHSSVIAAPAAPEDAAR
jgi:hypothetical protein